MSETPKQRSDPLVPLPGLLAELEVPIANVLAGTGLVEGDLAPNRFFELSIVLKILDNAVALTGREDFGLLLGAKNSSAVLGPLAHVVRAAPTLGEALLDLSASQDRNTSGAATYLRRQGKDIFFGYGVHRPGLVISPITQDLVLAILNRIITELTRGAIHPREYLSMRPMPLDPRRWSTLGAEVHFGAAETGFYLSSGDMAYPLPTSDPKVRERAMKEMLSQPALDSAEWTHRTRRALRALLLEGSSGMPEVARHLDINPRSLRRALVREGTSFEEVRDAVRLAIARDLLTMSKLSIGDLTLTLDFSNPSAFIRAFRRWTGQTPAAWREENVRRTSGMTLA